jgi:hypothetical protein
MEYSTNREDKEDHCVLGKIVCSLIFEGSVDLYFCFGQAAFPTLEGSSLSSMLVVYTVFFGSDNTYRSLFMQSIAVS